MYTELQKLLYDFKMFNFWLSKLVFSFNFIIWSQFSFYHVETLNKIISFDMNLVLILIYLRLLIKCKDRNITLNRWVVNIVVAKCGLFL